MVAVVIWSKIHIIVNMAGEEMRSHYGKALVVPNAEYYDQCSVSCKPFQVVSTGADINRH